MGDPASKATDRLHLLALAQLRLKFGTQLQFALDLTGALRKRRPGCAQAHGEKLEIGECRLMRLQQDEEVAAWIVWRKVREFKTERRELGDLVDPWTTNEEQARAIVVG